MVYPVSTYDADGPIGGDVVLIGDEGELVVGLGGEEGVGIGDMGLNYGGRFWLACSPCLSLQLSD